MFLFMFILILLLMLLVAYLVRTNQNLRDSIFDLDNKLLAMHLRARTAEINSRAIEKGKDDLQEGYEQDFLQMSERIKLQELELESFRALDVRLAAVHAEIAEQELDLEKYRAAAEACDQECLPRLARRA